MSHKEIDAAKYAEELARLMDVLIVRYNSEHGNYPSTYVRAKLRTQVINFLDERFPAETKLYRSYLAWMYSALGGAFRTIRNDEVPEEHRTGCAINNSVRGKLSAMARYRNTGIAAFRSDRVSAEEKKNQARLDILQEETLREAAVNGTGELPMLVQSSQKAVLNALDIDVAIKRYNMVVRHCYNIATLLPSDEVCGILLGMSEENVAGLRASFSGLIFKPQRDGFSLEELPQKTLLEQLLEKLPTLDEEELESLADLLKDIG